MDGKRRWFIFQVPRWASQSKHIEPFVFITWFSLSCCMIYIYIYWFYWPIIRALHSVLTYLNLQTVSESRWEVFHVFSVNSLSVLTSGGDWIRSRDKKPHVWAVLYKVSCIVWIILDPCGPKSGATGEQKRVEKRWETMRNAENIEAKGSTGIADPHGWFCFQELAAAGGFATCSQLENRCHKQNIEQISTLRRALTKRHPIVSFEPNDSSERLTLATERISKTLAADPDFSPELCPTSSHGAHPHPCTVLGIVSSFYVLSMFFHILSFLHVFHIFISIHIFRSDGASWAWDLWALSSMWWNMPQLRFLKWIGRYFRDMLRLN